VATLDQGFFSWRIDLRNLPILLGIQSLQFQSPLLLNDLDDAALVFRLEGQYGVGQVAVVFDEHFLLLFGG